MSVTHVQTRSVHSTANTATISISTTAGNLLGIWTHTNGGSTGAPTRTGETITNAIANFSDPATNNTRVDYAMNIGGTSNVVTVNGVNNLLNGAASEFAGAKTTAALGATHPTSTSTGGTTIQPGSITPTAASELWTGFQTPALSGTAAGTISTPFTVDEAGGANTVWDTQAIAGGTAHLDNVAASATNPTWTNNSGGTGMSAWMVEFLAAAGGAFDPGTVPWPSADVLPQPYALAGF